MRHVVMRLAGARRVLFTKAIEVVCECGGSGVIVVTPESAGYHRAASLDRMARPAQKPFFTSAIDKVVEVPKVRISTAYANERGDVYHFAADDPGGFGRRCPEHGKLNPTESDQWKRM